MEARDDMIVIGTARSTDRATAIPDRFSELVALESELDALVHCGTPEIMERIRRLTEQTLPGIAQRARFAEALVGHRTGADYGDDLPDVARDPVPDRFRIPLEISTAGIEDRRQFWTALAGGSYGVAPALHYAVRLDFDEESWLIVPDCRFCYRERLERLHTTRSLLGLVAENAPPAGFSPAFLILTTPARDGEGALVHVHDPDGVLMYGGRLRVEDGVAHFSFGVLGSRTETEGATPLEIEGRLSERGLHISGAWSAAVATHVDTKRVVKTTPSRQA
jgi:hypothetical protein